MYMLKLYRALLSLPIISLRTGGTIGKTLQPLINPNNLKIEAWYCNSVFTKNTLLLPAEDIREISKIGVAVNDQDSLTEPDDLIRLKQVASIQFDPIGKSVITESGQKLGKVEDYAVDIDSMYIVNLYVARRSIKSFTNQPLTVNRLQIVEITDKKIIVKDIEVTQKLSASAPMPVNA
ncbi:hypothetical protein EB118_04605 [bacterium]|nr:hypothetical protein [bacterium]NBX97675.1 hypothetical protein [bacterium]NDC94148.1 hypothetical protein [bacterium]NDD83145.1 hypothetical protein [bacterium]NDG29368.1 hypothetical protein [bacterium]